ncbi:MAG: BrnT family toxin [Chlorobiales bacterium]|nr:BrnT family toxin [Chlorobiales bacterium]
MKYFSWNTEKNEQLKAERGVSFEDVIFYIERGQLLDIVEHPNHEKYAGQRIFIININAYAYLVPFVEDEHEIFLKTIIPSRKATKKYLQGGEHEKGQAE